MGDGDLKPGETVLVCGGDGAGGMGCITTTYLDRLIAWYIGADEIEHCLQTKSAKCLPDLAMSALKVKALKGLKKRCRPNSFVPGTRVLMAGHQTKPIEDVRIGDRVIATDPQTGRTERRPSRTPLPAAVRRTSSASPSPVPARGPAAPSSPPTSTASGRPAATAHGSTPQS